jgi:hypothetical protein
MSFFAKLMLASWGTAIAMIGGCALYESGKLLDVLKRMAAWLESTTPQVSVPQGSLQAEHEDVA